MKRSQLVPPNNLPNPTASSIAKYVLDKIAVFGRALIEIMAKYASEIRREIRIEPTVKMSRDVLANDGRSSCPLLAQSGHWLVRCKCLLLTQSGHASQEALLVLVETRSWRRARW